MILYVMKWILFAYTFSLISFSFFYIFSCLLWLCWKHVRKSHNSSLGIIFFPLLFFHPMLIGDITVFPEKLIIIPQAENFNFRWKISSRSWWTLNKKYVYFMQLPLVIKRKWQNGGTLTFLVILRGYWCIYTKSRDYGAFCWMSMTHCHLVAASFAFSVKADLLILSLHDILSYS